MLPPSLLSSLCTCVCPSSSSSPPSNPRKPYLPHNLILHLIPHHQNPQKFQEKRKPKLNHVPSLEYILHYDDLLHFITHPSSSSPPPPPPLLNLSSHKRQVLAPLHRSHGGPSRRGALPYGRNVTESCLEGLDAIGMKQC
ncbi:hypothetical protein ACSQ67_025882 [Phaseolus vulgaris]